MLLKSILTILVSCQVSSVMLHQEFPRRLSKGNGKVATPAEGPYKEADFADEKKANESCFNAMKKKGIFTADAAAIIGKVGGVSRVRHAQVFKDEPGVASCYIEFILANLYPCYFTSRPVNIVKGTTTTYDLEFRLRDDSASQCEANGLTGTGYIKSPLDPQTYYSFAHTPGTVLTDEVQIKWVDRFWKFVTAAKSVKEDANFGQLSFKTFSVTYGRDFRYTVTFDSEGYECTGLTKAGLYANTYVFSLGDDSKMSDPYCYKVLNYDVDQDSVSTRETGDFQRESREDFPKILGPLKDTPNGDPGKVNFVSAQISSIIDQGDRIKVSVRRDFSPVIKPASGTQQAVKIKGDLTCDLEWRKAAKKITWTKISADEIDCSMILKRSNILV